MYIYRYTYIDIHICSQVDAVHVVEVELDLLEEARGVAGLGIMVGQTF